MCVMTALRRPKQTEDLNSHKKGTVIDYLMRKTNMCVMTALRCPKQTEDLNSMF